MITYDDLKKHAEALLNFCEYPAVQYKVKFSILDVPYEDTELSLLREAFLKSDIVEEMYQTQDDYGGWGKLQSKDYSVKAKIPTSSVGIERCLYIGLTVKDRDILFMAEEYLKTIFDAFTRAENSTTNKVQGTGLGMAITKNIVELMFAIYWKPLRHILPYVMKPGGNGCS